MNLEDSADSYYQASAHPPPVTTPLRGTQRAAVAVIGGGISGVSTALHLAERGVDVVVLESHQFGWGASGRSGGQIMPGYCAEQSTIEKLAGKSAARELWTHSMAAMDLLRNRIHQHQIACDLKWNYLHVATNKKRARELHESCAHLSSQYGYEMNYLERDELREVLASDLYYGAAFDAGSGHLHPLNYTLGLASAAQQAGARLHANSRALRIETVAHGVRIHTEQATLDCEQVVYACNAYLHRLESRLAKMMMPVATCIIATEPLGESRARALIANDAAVADTNLVLDYFRLSADWRMLFGGRVSYAGLSPSRLTRALRGRMTRAFPQLANARIDYSWGGYVAITMNRAPQIGRLDSCSWYVQGYSGQGMALSGYFGKLLADGVLGDDADLQCFGAIAHRAFPGGAWLRTPALVAAMSVRRLMDRIG